MTKESASAATAESYDSVAKWLHWLIAAMIVLQFVLANLAEGAEESGSKFQQLVLLANHKSVGITILSLAIVRLVWRFMHPPPAPLAMPTWQRRASNISHWSLYVLLILIPVSGWIISSAAAISVSWFNLFQLPDLVSANEVLQEVFEELHGAFAYLLLALAAVHLLAALKHTFVDRDGAIRRISSTLSIVLFVAVIVAGVMALTKIGRASESVAGPALSADASSESRMAASLPQWQIDYSNSFIRFTAEQAGAEFGAEWKEWQADMHFDEKRLDVSSFEVTVNANSVTTLDKDRDETLMDIEWFDEANFPSIFYRANLFSAAPDNHFYANGEMQVKGVRNPVTLDFAVNRDGNRVILTGNVTLDRIALGVGTGDWEDTTWVGQFVEVQVRVEAVVGE